MSLHDTQRLEIPHETAADLHERDPLGVYSHRQADLSTVAWTDAQGKRHEHQWTARGLEALLADVLAGGGL